MQRYRRIAAVAWRRIGEETVVVHLEANRIVGLDARGGQVWELLGEGVTADEAATSLFGDDAEPGARAAVADFLEELVAEGVVTVDGPRPDRPPAAPFVGGPRVTWREEVRRFAGACALQPGQSSICSQAPQNS